MRKKPGTPDEFPWHQDNGYTYVEPQQYLTCWVALTDATEAKGCTWVVPGPCSVMCRSDSRSLPSNAPDRQYRVPAA